jgi:molybdopterin-guanine dinucleotide biosynthesis protein A
METTGIILAGGLSSRMQQNKAFIKVGNQQIIKRIQKELQTVCTDLMIVTNTPEEYLNLGIPTVVDIIPRKGPLSGVHAGLVNSKDYYNLVVACDMPFISQRLAEYLLERVPGYAAAVARIGGRPQPLFAVYSKACIEPIEQFLHADRRSITRFVEEQKNLLWVEEASVEALALGNPNTLFLNVNTPQDWAEAQDLVQPTDELLEDEQPETEHSEKK